MSMSNDTVYTPADIEVLPCNDKEVSLTNSIIDITPCENTEISVRKKEYTIISDGLYIPEGPDAAPPWVTDLIDDAVNPWIGDHIVDLVIAGKSLTDALEALEIAHNAYNEMVYIDVRVDRAIAMHLTTLNARLDSNDASIINLNVTRVTPEEAAAISVRSISSSLNSDSPDSIGGRFTSVGSSISTLAGNVTKTHDLLESRYGELNDAVVNLEVEVGAAVDEVYSSFLYDSTLRVGDDSYKSGFGLNASVKIPVPGQPGVYRSEFWIDAQRFKFTNSNQTGAVSPFTIDTSGSNPEIKFNGAVSFSNITGPDKPDANATRNEGRGFWTVSTSYYKGDIVSSDGNSWAAKIDHSSNPSNKPPSTSAGSSDTWVLFASKGADGADGTSGTSGAATTTVYKRATSVTTPSAGTSNPPSGWDSSVPNDSDLPVWECVGNHPGDGMWVWQPPSVSATFWTKPSSTYIDGNKIFTGDAYVDTLQIKGHAITINEYVETYESQLLTHVPEDGPWTTFVSKALVHPGYSQGAAGVIVIINFAAVGHGHTDVDCRVVRSGWEPTRLKFSVTSNMTNSYVAYFFDPNPPVDPTYRVQFRVNDITGSDSGTIWHTKAVFMSGKR